MLQFQNLVLEQVAKGATLKESLSLLCTEAERFFPNGVCSVLEVDEAGLLRPVAAPAFPKAYLDALDGLPIGPEVGSCGSAIYHNNYVCVEDLETDPRWAMYKSLAVPLGYHACSSLPIHDEAGRPIGALAVYFREKHAPSMDEREAMAACADLCGIALTRRKRVSDKQDTALVDGLTGLPNRAAFDHTLSQMRCELPGSWALLVVDIDDFRVANDTFGHEAGDELLRAVGQRIASVVAPDIVFRSGGDEFAIVLQNPQLLRDLHETADQVFKQVAAPVLYERSSIQPQVSIGAAVLMPQDVAPGAVLRNANFALYQAKETLRGGFVRYWPGIDTRLAGRGDAVREVIDALTDGRIGVHYQPVVALEGCSIAGFEALSCMRNTSGRILPASVFQEAFNDARVAADLTQCVLATVARDIRSWLDQGLPVQSIGVNLTSADFYFGNLTAKIEQIFAAENVPLKHLVVEVTENAYLGQRDQVMTGALHELRARGIRIALDDFGTGFAALSHLLSVPADCIKIDRSFVQPLSFNHPSAAVIRGVLQIANEIGLRAVVEGVETLEQAEMLSEMGCILVQGFLFSRSVEHGEATELLRKHGTGIVEAAPMPMRPPVLKPSAESAALRVA